MCAAKKKPSVAAAGPSHPTLVWGQGETDALSLQDPGALGPALTRLAAVAEQQGAWWFWLWDPSGALLEVLLRGEDALVSAVWTTGKFASSLGQEEQQEHFTAEEPDGSAQARIPWSACVPWSVARLAVESFASTGALPRGLPVTETLHTGILRRAMAGAPPAVHGAPHTLEETGLAGWESQRPTEAPTAAAVDTRAWAERLVDLLLEQQLLDLADGADPVDVAAHVAGLLDRYRQLAGQRANAVEQVADGLLSVPGVEDLYADAEELQVALGRALKA